MSVPSNPKLEEDKQLIEDFYKLLPLIAQILLDEPPPLNPLAVPIPFVSDDKARRLAHIDNLLKLKKNGKHLEISSLKQIDPKMICPQVQRTIKHKIKKKNE